MQPAARPINSLSDKLRQDQKENAGQIHRQRAPANPTIVNQTRDHEREKTNCDPVRLLAPEICRDGISAHISCAVDCHHAKNGKRKHGRQQEPIEPKQFSEKGRHAKVSGLSWSANKTLLISRWSQPLRKLPESFDETSRSVSPIFIAFCAFDPRNSV